MLDSQSQLPPTDRDSQSSVAHCTNSDNPVYISPTKFVDFQEDLSINRKISGYEFYYPSKEFESQNYANTSFTQRTNECSSEDQGLSQERAALSDNTNTYSSNKDVNQSSDELVHVCSFNSEILCLDKQEDLKEKQEDMIKVNSDLTDGHKDSQDGVQMAKLNLMAVPSDDLQPEANDIARKLNTLKIKQMKLAILNFSQRQKMKSSLIMFRAFFEFTKKSILGKIKISY